MSEQINNELSAEEQESSTPSSVPIFSVGAALRAAREAKGLPIADLARTLKLGQRQVEALERDEWSILPGPTFIRGFVRNYARMVDLDAEPLMHGLDTCLAKPLDTLLVSDSVSAPIVNSSRSRDGLVMGVGAVLLVLAALAYFLLPNDLNVLRSNIQHVIDGTPATPTEVLSPSVAVEVPLQQTPQPAQEGLFPPGATPAQVIAPQLLNSASHAEPATASVPGTVLVAPQQAAQLAPKAALPVLPSAAQSAVQSGQPRPSSDLGASSAGQLRFVLTQESWVEVRDRDGAVAFSQRLPGGSEQMVSGKAPFSLVIGFAPGVRLFSHGKAVELAPHTKGDVARLVLE